jgi:hypothetical protein
MNLGKRSWWSLGVVVALGVALGACYAAALAQEENERGEREGIRGEARREEREGREREVREGGEREERVQPRRERAEAEARERGERRPAEREGILHRIEVLKMALPALMEAERRDAAEAVERAIRAHQMELEGRNDDQAHQIRERAPGRGQLAEILRMAAGLWREFNNEEKAAMVARLAMELGGEGEGERERPRPEGPAPELMRKRQELEEQARRIKHAIEELRDDQDEEARELQARWREITAELGRLRPEGRAPEEMRERVARANELRRALESAMREGQEDRANALRRELQELMPDRGGRPAPPQARPDARREVEELREQLRALQGHMREMNQRMERIEGMLRSLADDDDGEEADKGEEEDHE